MPFAGNEARVPALVETHLRLDRSAGDQRPAKGLGVARPCTHANNGNLHAGGSVGETGSPGIGRASGTALRALQSYGQADRIAKGGYSYAEQNNSK